MIYWGLVEKTEATVIRRYSSFNATTELYSLPRKCITARTMACVVWIAASESNPTLEIVLFFYIKRQNVRKGPVICNRIVGHDLLHSFVRNMGTERDVFTFMLHTADEFSVTMSRQPLTGHANAGKFWMTWSHDHTLKEIYKLSLLIFNRRMKRRKPRFKSDKVVRECFWSLISIERRDTECLGMSTIHNRVLAIIIKYRRKSAIYYRMI